MAIKGLTDFESSAIQLSDITDLVARVRKGEPKTDPKKPGKALDYFRVEFEEPFKHLQPVFEEIYGTEPDELNGAMVIGDTPESAFVDHTWNEYWTYNRLAQRCDGEMIVKWFDSSTNRTSREPKPCMSNCKCTPTGRLNFMLKEFMLETGVLGTFLLSTHSVTDIQTITKNLMGIYKIHKKIQGIPLRIFRNDRELKYWDEKAGEEKSRTHSLVNIAIDADFFKHVTIPQLYAPVQAQLSAPEDVPALPEPNIVVMDDGLVVDANTGEILSAPGPTPTIQRYPPVVIQSPPQADADDDEQDDEPPQGKNGTSELSWLKVDGKVTGKVMPIIREGFNDDPQKAYQYCDEALKRGEITPDMTAEEMLAILRPEMDTAPDNSGSNTGFSSAIYVYDGNYRPAMWQNGDGKYRITGITVIKQNASGWNIFPNGQGAQSELFIKEPPLEVNKQLRELSPDGHITGTLVYVFDVENATDPKTRKIVPLRVARYNAPEKKEGNDTPSTPFSQA